MSMLWPTLPGAMKKFFLPVLIAGAGAVAIGATLSSCSKRTAAAPPSATTAGTVRLDAFCAPFGLSPTLRHTVVLVDASTIKNVAPEEFSAQNPALLKLIHGLAIPDIAMQTGTIVPRERVTLIAASPRTGAHSTVFTGCMPGLSETEMRNADKGNAFDKYFGSDLNSKLREDRELFQKSVLTSLMQMKNLAEPPSATADGDFASSPLVRILKALPSPSADDIEVRRVYVFTDISRSPPPVSDDIAAVRAEAFKHAKTIALQLGLSDVSIVDSGSTGNLGLAENYFSAFLLGSQAQLRQVGAFSAETASAPPTSIALYRGTLKVADYEMPLTLRLGIDGRGRLVGSWISYTASFGVRATPLTGDFICTDERDCVLKSSPEGGLGQLWRLSGGDDPEAREDAPFGGLRYLEATEKPAGMEGRIFDPVISIGEPGGGMTFSVKRAVK